MRRLRPAAPGVASRARALAIAASALGLALGAPAAAGAAPTWLAPVSISGPGQSASTPQVIASAAVVWDGPGDVVQVSRHEEGGGFGAPVSLSAGGQDVRAPQLATQYRDPTIESLAVWERFDGASYVVQSAAVRDDGTVTAPVTLSTAGQDAAHTQLAASLFGDAVAVWERPDGASTRVQAVVRPPVGGFGAPVDLSGAGADARDPQVAQGRDETIVAWRRFDGTSWIVQAATRATGGGFSAPVNLSAAGGDALAPQVTIDERGVAIVVWRRFDGTHWIVQAAVRPAGGSFGSPMDVSGAGEDGMDPDVASGYGDDSFAVWRAVGVAGNVPKVARLARGAGFGAPADLGSAAPNAFAPRIAMNGNDWAIVAWHRFDGTRNVVQAVVRPLRGSFSAPAAISAAGEDATDPQVSLAALNDGVAVWQRSGASPAVRGAGYDVGVPTLSVDVLSGKPLLGVTAGSVGRPVTFTAPPASDFWSPLGVPTWTFGDGPRGSGTSVAHTYTRPGSFRVTLRVPDAVDNAATVEDTIAIAANAVPLPAIANLRVAPATFRAARSGGPVRSAAPGRTGARVTYELSMPASVRMRIERGVAARIVGGRCVSQSRRNRGRPACTRYLRVRGSFLRKRAVAGRDRFTFTGRLAGRTLRPGRYRLRAVPFAGGLTGATVRARFRLR